MNTPDRSPAPEHDAPAGRETEPHVGMGHHRFLVLDLTPLGSGVLSARPGEGGLAERIGSQVLPYARRVLLAASHGPRPGESLSGLAQLALSSGAEVLFRTPLESNLELDDSAPATAPQPALGDLRIRVAQNGALSVATSGEARPGLHLGNLLETDFDQLWSTYTECATQPSSATRAVPGAADGFLANSLSSSKQLPEEASALISDLRSERDDLRRTRDAALEEHRANLAEHKALIEQLEHEVATCDAELAKRQSMIGELQVAVDAHEAQLHAYSVQVARLEHILGRVRGHRLYKWMKRLGRS